MKTPSIIIGAGQRIEFFGSGNYFHILTATAELNVTLKRNEAVIAEAEGVSFGYKSRPRDGFTGFTIYSAVAQTVRIGIGDGDDDYNYITGSVQIIGNTGAHIQTHSSVTNANNQLLAANAGRKYLFVQNNSAAGVLRLKTNGTIASLTSGMRLQPGQSYEPVGFIPTGSINAFMETVDATAFNVEVIEG